LLIEAFRIKDEAAEETKKKTEAGDLLPPAEPAASAPVDSALARSLSSITGVQEFAIFDLQQTQVAMNTGVCTVATFEVDAFTQALTAISQDLGWSQYRSMSLGTTKRNRYLLLNQPQQQLVLKLKPGVQAAQVQKEIERIAKL
jgi:hypothetical protein